MSRPLLPTLAVVLLIGVLSLAGCATSPDPADRVDPFLSRQAQSAETSVEHAKPADDLRQVSYQQPVESPFAPEPDPAETYPIDLETALQLGGANSLHIRLVRERVREARLQLTQARMMWVPSLRAGVGYNRHDGRLQATEGEVIDANRNSLFLGGGMALGHASPAGGSSGPARLGVDLPLADVWFERLATRQMFSAAGAAQDAGVNDTLLAVAVAYFDLVEAHGLLADAESALAASEEMVTLTTKFAEQAQLSRAEVARAKAERGLRQRAVEDAHRQTLTRSAELARVLRLDPTLRLLPQEDRMLPVELIDGSIPLDELLSTGLAYRPELHQYRHLVAATNERIRQEHWRPWLPHLGVGYSAGTFGGGTSGTFDDQSGRGDFDAWAVWQLENLGAGNHVRRRQRESQNRQVCLQYQIVRDKVLSEIATAAADVAGYGRQIDSTMSSIQAAEESYRLNRQRIQEGEGLPIEMLQAIRARADAQNAYLSTVANYNRAQFRLLWAVGEPPSVGGL